MDLDDALTHAVNGHLVSRTEWPLDLHMRAISHTHFTIGDGTYQLQHSDIIADDWFIVGRVH